MSGGEDASIAELYKQCDILDKAVETSSDKVLDFKSSYETILKGTKGGPKGKKLAAQLIPRHFKYFPSLQEDAMNSLIDLCEEDDLQVRLLAVRSFAPLGKEVPSVVTKIADVLGQLLQSELPAELAGVKDALTQLLHIDAKGVIHALFTQMATDESGLLREKAIAFLQQHVFPLRAELLHPHSDVEQFLADEVKKLLVDVTGSEFKIFLTILSSLHIFKGERAVELLELIADQAHLKGDFQASDADSMERLLSCMSMAQPFFQRGVTSPRFLSYLGAKVLPTFDELSETARLSVLRSLAEMAPYAGAEEARTVLEPVYHLLKSQVPTKEEAAANPPKINFSHVECLLYIFHQLADKAPLSLKEVCGIRPLTGQPSDFDGKDEADKKLADLRQRLTFLHETTAVYIKQLSASHRQLKLLNEPADKERKETVGTALATCQSVDTAVQALLQQPKPRFLVGDSLPVSWKQAATNKDINFKAKAGGQKGSKQQSGAKKSAPGSAPAQQQQQAKPASAAAPGSGGKRPIKLSGSGGAAKRLQKLGGTPAAKQQQPPAAGKGQGQQGQKQGQKQRQKQAQKQAQQPVQKPTAANGAGAKRKAIDAGKEQPAKRQMQVYVPPARR